MGEEILKAIHDLFHQISGLEDRLAALSSEDTVYVQQPIE
jgi:hypothetical protein